MIVHYALTDPSAHQPQKSYDDDLCWDLCAHGDHELVTYATIPTSMRIHIPRGYYGMILSRSGFAKDFGCFVLNAPGIIDAGYAGEVNVILGNIDPSQVVYVSDGDRIAQLAIFPHDPVYLSRDDSLQIYSNRGANGFGSTGY